MNQDKSGAESIYDQAFTQLLGSSKSFMEVVPEYISPESLSQQLRIDFIPNNLGVHIDDSYRRPNYTDMMWAIIETTMSKKEYENKYSAFNFTSFDSSQNSIIKDEITLARYYKIHEIPKKTLLLSDGQMFIEGFADSYKIKSLLEKEYNGYKIWQVIDDRQSFDRQLEYYICNGSEIIEERKDLLGKYIPIIPCEGRIIWDRGKRYVNSFIRPSKESARLLSYARSTEVEIIALQPLATWIGAEGQFSENDFQWSTINSKKWPYVEYKTRDVDGNPVPEPKQISYNGPANQLTGLIQSYYTDIDKTTGVYDDSLMGGPSQLRSGIAIDLKQSQGNLNNFDFIDGFITRSLTYLGIVLNDLIPHYYTDQRIVKLIADDGKSEEVQLNSSAENDITEGEYEVSVKIGSATTSQRKEQNDLIMSLVDKFPAMQNMLPEILKNLDSIKDKERMIKIANATLPPDILAQLDQDEQAIFAENVQLKQQVQEVSAQLQEATDLIKSMQIDYKKAMDVQQLKSETDITKTLITQQGQAKDEQIQNAEQIVNMMMQHINTLNKRLDDITGKLDSNKLEIEIEEKDDDESE
jgi:hypothetical protein